MDPVSNAIRKLKLAIPKEILSEAFSPRRYDATRQARYRDTAMIGSLDAQIRKQVIDGQVSPDVNLCSGVETTVPLTTADREYLDSWNIVYRIPKSVTGGRTITAAYEVVYGVGFSNQGFFSPLQAGASPLISAGQRILNATMGSGSVSTHYVSIIGENTILVNDVTQLQGSAYLRCMLTHEPNFANLKPAYYSAFAELVVLATKAFVYNELVIKLDEGENKAGQTLGRFREILDGYADSYQLYSEYLDEKWPKLATMNSTETSRAIYRAIVGSKR